MTHTEIIAYTAGLIDGEGYLILVRRSPRRTHGTAISVSMTHRPTIDWLQGQFGGRVYEHQRGPVHETIFQWKLAERLVIIKLLRDLMPYLKVKAVAARLLLDYCERFQIPLGRAYSEEQYQEMTNYETLMRRANSTGRGSSHVKAQLEQHFNPGSPLG